MTYYYAKGHEAAPIILPTPPAFLADVPESILVAKNPRNGFADRHRDYFQSRGLVVPNMLDVVAERERRRRQRRGRQAA